VQKNDIVSQGPMEDKEHKGRKKPLIAAINMMRKSERSFLERKKSLDQFFGAGIE